MKYITEEEFFENFQPLKNEYFPKAPYQGCLYDPSLLAQISGFTRTHQIWTVQREEEIVVKETGEKKYTFTATSGLTPYGHLIGYFVTKESTKGQGPIKAILSLP